MSGLRKKISLLVLLPILFVLTSIGGLAVDNKKNSENDMLFDRFNSYRVLLESGDLSFETINDKKKLEAVLDEEVDLAEILRRDYSVLYSSENSAAPLLTAGERGEVDDAFNGIETIRELNMNGTPFFSIITPLVVNGKIVAVLHQVISNIQSTNRVNEYIIYVVLLMLAGFGVSFFAIFILLDKVILRNIYKLKRATLEIQKGNLDIDTKIDSDDEIGDLATAFGQMIGELKKDRKEMEEYNQKLKRDVAERTSALGIAEQKLRVASSALQDQLTKISSGLGE